MSGSAKTTPAQHLAIRLASTKPSRGHLIVEGANLVSLTENELARLRLDKMGFVFQNYNLLGNFTAQENVEAPMVLAGVGRKERKQRSQAFCWRTSCGLGDRSTSITPGELLRGVSQQPWRIARASATANNPHPSLSLPTK